MYFINKRYNTVFVYLLERFSLDVFFYLLNIEKEVKTSKQKFSFH